MDLIDTLCSKGIQCTAGGEVGVGGPPRVRSRVRRARQLTVRVLWIAQI